jgi:hypothetical protein
MTRPSFEEEWAPPEKFRGVSLPLWPEGVFPEPFGIFVHELARSTETPVELAALMMLPAIATAAQRIYKVQIKADYSEPLNIWTSVALPSGSRKSAVQEACTRPLTQFENNLRETIEPVKKQIEARNKVIELRLKEQRTKAGRVDNNFKFEEMTGKIIEFEKELKTVPIIPQLWSSDITPENLASVMADNEDCMAILSDEAGIFDILAGRYNGGIPNLDLFLKAHSGTPCRVNRCSKPPIFLQTPTLTMGLSPQPSLIEDLSLNSAFRGRGLLARFLYSLPVSNIGSRTLNEPPMDFEIEIAYTQSVRSLLERAYANEREKEGKRLLKLSKEAFEKWQLFGVMIEAFMGDEGSLSHIKDWAGKLPGAIARIAALLHVMRYSNSVPENIAISEGDMMSAIRIGWCLQGHALAVFELLGKDKNLGKAQVILSWIERKGYLEFTKRECHRGLRSHFQRAKELDPTLQLLVDHSYIREKKVESQPNRPSAIYEVNPYLYRIEALS